MILLAESVHASVGGNHNYSLATVILYNSLDRISKVLSLAASDKQIICKGQFAGAQLASLINCLCAGLRTPFPNPVRTASQPTQDNLRFPNMLLIKAATCNFYQSEAREMKELTPLSQLVS